MPPPARMALTGVQPGPAWARGLNQKAQSQTTVPGARAASNCTPTLVRVVLPSNFQSASSAGGVAPPDPTWLNRDAPLTPAGLRRREAVPSCSLIVTVVPERPTTSRWGACDGAGIGAAVARTFNPRSSRCASL